MAFLKGFALTVLSLLLVAFLVLIQVGNTLNNTALSSAYFNDAFDKNVTNESIEDFASYLKNNIGDMEDEVVAKALRDAIDVKWLQKDMPAFLKGSFEYFTTGEGKIPSFSVKPMKEALKIAIDSKAAEMSTMAESYIGLDKVKDTFDPNVYFTKLYGSGTNPVTAFGDILSGTRASFTLLLVLTALLLFAIIAVIAYRPRSILNYAGACLLSAGLICSVGALLPIVFRNSGSVFVSSMFGNGGEADLLFLKNWILSFAGGVVTYMLVQGLIVSAAGVAFLVAAGFIRENNGRNKRSAHVGIRTAVALVLLAAIPFSAYFIGKSYYTQHVKPFASVQKMRGKMTPGEAFDATMGGSLGKIFFSEGE
jgi:hypothetical protein